jgi:hypothetical protein
MKIFGSCSTHSPEARTRRRPSRCLSSALAAVLFAALMAVCGSAAATTSAASAASVARSSAAPMSVAAAPRYYLRQSGNGNKVLRAVSLPSKWYLVWRFDCGTKRGTFVLTSTKKGLSPFTVTRQTGLGGGGQRPFIKAGRYQFGIRTTCPWKVAAASSLPAAA